jgi:hypothetical protein
MSARGWYRAAWSGTSGGPIGAACDAVGFPVLRGLDGLPTMSGWAVTKQLGGWRRGFRQRITAGLLAGARIAQDAYIHPPTWNITRAQHPSFP